LVKHTNFYYPKSVLKLLVIGFVVVSLPLVIALVNAAISVQRLANQSEAAVDQAVQAARGSRLLMEQVLSMERVTRQYLILDDPGLLDDYQKLRGVFEKATADIAQLPLDAEQRAALQHVIDQEHSLSEALQPPPEKAEDRQALVEGYVNLSASARSIVNESGEIIDREIEHMRASAERSQKSLLLQLVWAFPLGLLTAALFAFLISRPIAQLEHGIRQLGSGELDQRIELHGPADLEYLGERLEWLRHRLIEIEEQKAIFLRHMSHELKTPLTVLREGAELLADGTTGPLNATQRDVIGIMQSNSIQLQQMIEDLLNYQRALASVSRLEKQPVDVAQIAAAVIERQRLSAAGRHIALQLQASASPMDADGDKLRVVLDNLLSNAIKFSPEGAKVSLVVHPGTDAVQIDVIDQGPGVPAGDRSKVFDWFFQGERMQSGRIKGSGLGLAIAREFVLAHHGSIDVLGAQGGGAQFQVRLPRQVPGRAEPATESGILKWVGLE
jgi:two-component system sensor histidine kinase GlrK